MCGTMNFLYVAIGGAAGSVARYYLTGRVADWYGPGALGVFVVNIVGSFMIGLFLTLATERFLWPPELRVLVAAGFLGGFTTFSSLTWELLQQAELSDFTGVSVNIAGSLACGLAAVYLGAVIGRTI